jgi:general secretion pathway protein F
MSEGVVIILCIALVALMLAIMAIAVMRLTVRHATAIADLSVDTIAAWYWFLLFSILFVVAAAFAGLLGLLLWAVTLVITLMIFARYRAMERRTLVGLLAVAMEKGIPLGAAARAFAQDCRGRIRRRARRLADMLDRGVPLPQALEESGARLPIDAQVAINMGCEGGALSAAVGDATNAAVRLDPVVHTAAVKVMYLIALLAFAAAAFAYVMIKIMPQYVKIFDDFDTELPSTTVRLIWFASAVTGGGIGTLVAIGLGVCILVMTLFALSRYAGNSRWDPPLVRRLWRRLDQAVVLRSLAQAVEQRRTLATAIDGLARLYPKRHIRRRLQVAAARVNGGGDWCGSLQATGMLRPAEAGVLKAAERMGNLGWALREMADRNVRTFAARVSAFLAVAFPLLLLAVGALALVFASGLFLPLVDLIWSML